mgnify:FL=1
MAQTIKLKRSSTGGAVPSTSSLSLGEVAINTYDGKMYIKKNDGSDAIVEIGAGNGEAVWNSYDYTATSSQTSFSGSDNNSETLSYVPNFLQVFLNGILLDPAVDYAATTGNSIVLTVGATTSDLIQIETFTQIIGTGDILVDTFPVSSTQTAFTLSQDPVNKNNISVYVEGVYQESSTYSLSTTTLTLSESPANGTTVEVVIGTRNVTLDDIADLTISGTLHAGALDLGDANIINVNEISLDTIKGDADANTNITFAGSDVTTFTQGGTERLRLNTTGAQVTGNIVVSGNVDGRDVAADGVTADAALPRTGGAMGGAITTNSTFDGRDVSVDGTKLDGIESGATADQTDVEIRAAVESASDSNVFTNADHSKLDGIEALADVTDATNVTAAGALMRAGGTMTGALDMGSNNITTTGKMLFANVYSATGDLPSASTYHGMFAHVHGTGKGYFAHAGSWVELANQSGLTSTTTTANAALPKAGGTMTGTLAMGANAITSTGDVGMATGHSSGKFAVMASSVHGSYDFYNNGTSYFNGAVTVDEVLNVTGTNKAIQMNGVTRINGVGDIIGTSYYVGANAVIDTSRNITAGTISSGAITSSGKIIAPKLSIQNQINTTSSNLEINYENGDGTTTSFKDFYVRDGKNAVVLTIQGSSKSATFSGTISSGAITSTSSITGRTGTFTGQNGTALEVNSGTTNVTSTFKSNDAQAWINIKDSTSSTYGTLLGAEGGLFRLRTNNNDDNTDLTVDTLGNLNVSGEVSTTNAKLKAITASNTDTAVDVFVYDTRKDSDGGAWRKRTQHTSWYNEALNTSTRGARKEFPSVAVIVADSTAAETYIYDGDDPDLPMWMVFDNSSYSILRSHGANMNLTMLNGKLMVGLAPNDAGIGDIDFVSDRAFRHTTSAGYTNKGTYKGSISERNSGKGFDGIDANPIVNIFVNDVAMTVLPNAPIDADTGLPVPTIAVATNGGVSVIKDDGTVVDITYTNYTISEQVKFLPSGGIIYSTDAVSGQRWIHVDHSLPSSDLNKNQVGYKGDLDDEMYHLVNTSTYLGEDMKLRIMDSASGFIVDNSGDVVLGASNAATGGLGFISRNPSNPSEGLTCDITSSHNTGWMNGDIKLATLSDTDTTNVTGSELSNVSSFTDLSGTGNSVSESSGTVTGTHAGSGGLCHYKGALFSTVAGNTYTVVLNHTSGSTCSFRVKDGGNDATIGQKSGLSTVGIVSITFTATSTSAYMDFFNNSQFIFNSLSIRSGEFDRSYNNNGLQVFGTVTKTAVATGAELVGYSGFSTSNYLQQPYNADMDFTTDMSISYWIKGGAVSESLMDRGSLTRYTDYSWHIYHDGGSDYRLTLHSDGSTEQQFEIADVVGTSTWQHVVWTLSAGIVKGYWNGIEKSSAAFSGTLTSQSSTQHSIKIGRSPVTGTSHSGSLALVRVSGTAPTAEQIKKMYNDEKHLFQENAKATLYGTSEAVTALAYDDDTELLHVGTSAGRSEFQGLRRVNNTTDAVSAAISASNGFIVEE